MKTMYSIEEATKIISSGAVLMIAGEESLLKQLPKGNWIGGTIPYFMSEDGGVTTEKVVQIQTLASIAKVRSVKFYEGSQLTNIPKDYSPNGFSMIIAPGLSDIHLKFGSECYGISGIFNSPLSGWVAGIHLDKLGKQTPKVVDGKTGEFSDKKVIVMHMDLPETHYANIETVNLFKQGKGDTIEFAEPGFSVSQCLVNGAKANFAEYVTTKKINHQLPLVADYSGVSINVSIQAVDEAKKTVSFYNAVQKGVTYRFADPLPGAYPESFQKSISADKEPFFSCNCVLNYLYAGLEGKKTGKSIGPMTFGEIAYVLHNQTMVYITLEKK